MTCRIDESRRAVIVFDGKALLPFLRFLKEGFRHCFVVIQDGNGWIIYDPRANHTTISTLSLPAEVDIVEHYRRQGRHAVGCRIPEVVSGRKVLYTAFTCVEAAKRVIGLHAFWVMTPWQLYRRLAIAEVR